MFITNSPETPPHSGHALPGTKCEDLQRALASTHRHGSLNVFPWFSPICVFLDSYSNIVYLFLLIFTVYCTYLYLILSYVQVFRCFQRSHRTLKALGLECRLRLVERMWEDDCHTALWPPASGDVTCHDWWISWLPLSQKCRLYRDNSFQDQHRKWSKSHNYI